MSLTFNELLFVTYLVKLLNISWRMWQRAAADRWRDVGSPRPAVAVTIGEGGVAATSFLRRSPLSSCQPPVDRVMMRSVCDRRL